MIINTIDNNRFIICLNYKYVAKGSKIVQNLVKIQSKPEIRAGNLQTPDIITGAANAHTRQMARLLVQMNAPFGVL
jgi:hypothetical protein